MLEFHVDSNGINWKSDSNDTRDGYFGEFKVAINYRNFISKIKGEGIRPGYVPEHVWERWMELWGSVECIKKSEINAKNHRAGHETAAGTHTGGSISMGEHHKKLAIEKGRDPTPGELHLHVHTHGHDEKSFVDKRSRIVHMMIKRDKKLKRVTDFAKRKKRVFSREFEEIVLSCLKENPDDRPAAKELLKTPFFSEIESCGGEKKRRIYGLRSEAKSYYGQKFSASSSVLPSISQSTLITNMDELVKQMLPALTNHFLPVVMGRVQEGSTPIDNPSTVTLLVPPSTTTNEDEVDP
ncbi:hypothetical protein KY290_006540 [Solanum tuberosum]|uniref:Uncharacterized protein n=1 Tax=Solanum tuberosum TaxID=4113 RepID=A0ABQ7WHA7_SOLTU|nr:hypothetical protein KY289_006868 [Solanum tuberosum]KAH0780113.1 hypothetical protein KY290_006540 [Solanum tuberosum]